MASILKVPELGEGIDTVDVVKVLVAVGETVAVDQPVIEVETEKASVEVPSELAGVITEINVRVGDSLGAGAAILAVEPTSADPSSSADLPEAGPSNDNETTASDSEQPERDADRPQPPERTSESAEAPAVTEDAAREVVHVEPMSQSWSVPDGRRKAVPAAPTVRRFAREVGVDIATVTGSGPGGRISIDDVKHHTARMLGRTEAGHQVGGAARELPDFTAWGPVHREPMTKIRRATARNLARAWITAPQVTNNDWADITTLDEFRAQYRDRVEAAGGKLTVTSILVKVTAAALRVFPTLNASVDQAADEIVYKDYCHIGVAVDTERGLLVPVIRDVDTKSITEISVELNELARRARDRKLTPADMQGGTFSISNLGGIGGTGFSPIVNWPEVAILGVSRGLIEPRWNGEAFAPRLILPLSLSYDHRLVDGADAARFLRWIAEALEQPLLLALEG